MAEVITKEQMNEQRSFMAKIKEENNIFAITHGRERTACTKTYGCQQNENDTERIRGMLRECGFSFVDNEEDADLVIYNTCAVRENAEQKVFGRLGILKHMKEERHGDMTIAVCGCMVQQEHIAKQIKKVHNHVDLVFGTHALYRMPKLLYEAMHRKKAVFDIENSDGRVAEDIPTMHESKYQAWVSVMFGCNNFCSYCIVPYVRGRERSRKSADIIREIKELVNGGCSEISLLGQNVNSYGKDLDEDIDFAKLLRMVNEVEGVKRIRFMTSHPKDLSDDLIDAMAECDKVCHQLHLPFQAGNDRVLREMNRHYTRDEYLEKIRKIKKKIPDIFLSSDVIVGFPTETNEDFEDTIKVIEEVEFDHIYSFIYSRREGTPAAKLDFVLSDEEIHKNFNRLLEVQNAISKRKNDAYVGTVQTVLVEGKSIKDDNVLSGRCDSSKIVNFKGSPDLIGKYVKVKVTQAMTWSLNGELAE